MTSATRQAAQHLIRQRLALDPIVDLPASCRPHTIREGYAIQSELNTLLTEAGMGTLVGHKIGCTTPVMQAFVNIPHPCAGRIFSSTVLADGAHVPHSGFVRMGVECEIAVRLAQDLKPRGQPFTRDSVATAVGAVMPAIEIVDERYRDYHALGIPTLIADDFFNAGCVLGQPLTDWRHLDLAGLLGRASINGIEVGRGHGELVLGHPLNALAWLANSRIEAGLSPLLAGEFILLGSVVATQWLQPGDVFSIAIDSLGELSLTLDQ